MKTWMTNPGADRVTFPRSGEIDVGRARMALIATLLTLAIFPTPLRAVITLGGLDPTFNTTAPTGALAGSGWQYISTGGKLGTAISPHHFLTARHTGGSVGQTFVYEGISHTLTGYYDSPNSDLRIWSVDGRFSSYAPLYTGSDEAGKDLVVYGRGTQRGAEIRSGGILMGWEWGSADGQLRWGENTVDAAVSVDGLGQMLMVGFENNGNPNEAHLSTGDSGGPVFLQEDGLWKLAGINYGVDSASQAIFGSHFYSTRISDSDNYSWINSVITPVPEPATWATGTGVGLATFALIRRRRTGGRRDPARRPPVRTA